MKFCFIFDLDGVLVESLDFERAVSDLIVQTIGIDRHLSRKEAERLWLSTLRTHRDHPRWHDYGLHCSALGLTDEWKSFHEQVRQLICPMPSVLESLQSSHYAGSCWLASDATQWVVEFKLRAAGINLTEFDEVFTLDRCLASKGHHEFWEKVKACVPNEETHLIYIDNRDDRLLTAAEVLPKCSLVKIIAEDHPTSLGLFFRKGSLTDTRVYQAASSDLPSVLKSITQTIRASE
ncbi:FMN phosphatase YigB, HAD superfamily [Singulisphaera sp. GP187]|uniref:HAD family hydrolase n=1 Tax=Singulisphaera sp. GP187 TaxID=1882752 RepID=UPI00092819AE|nr:HAD family hydrolase [Singulisphaera sp. GP187]SIO35426.1 FMN phosphatase YigB, HAD superfamily [Singulisphaera sp. GP187]